MNVYLQGLAFGMVLQLSVGPVCLGVFQRALLGRLGPALWMVVGVALADALCVTLALLGVAALLQVALVRVLVGLGGAAVLAYFGYRTLRSAGAVAKAAGSDVESGSLRYGFLLTMTNPLTILFWGGVFAGLAAGSFGSDRAAGALFGAGCASATLLFLSAVATGARTLSRLLTAPAVLTWLNRAVGVFLVAFAVKLALDAVGFGPR